MGSITAPSKWSMSVHSDQRFILKLKIYAQRWFYIIAVPVLTLYCLILCGCVSGAPIMSNIFVVEFDDVTKQQDAKIRIGYFGICAKGNNGKFKCSSSMLFSPRKLADVLSTSRPAIDYAVKLQRALSFVTLSTAGLILVAGLITLLALQIISLKQKPSLLPKPSRTIETHITNLTQASRVLLWISTALALAAAYSLHCAISALQIATSPENGIEVGARTVRGVALEAMQWSTFGLSLFFSTCVQIKTRKTTQRKYRYRSSRSPFLDTVATQSEMRITTPPGRRLARIDVNIHNRSQVSITGEYGTSTAASDISRIDSMKQYLLPPVNPHPPLATLQRNPTLKLHSQSIRTPGERAVSPLLPSPITTTAPAMQAQRQQVEKARSQYSPRSPLTTQAKQREDPGLLSPTFYTPDNTNIYQHWQRSEAHFRGDGDVMVKNIGAKKTPSVRRLGGPGHRDDEKPLLSPIIPLQGILKGTPPSTPVSTGAPAASLGEGRGQKNPWL